MKTDGIIYVQVPHQAKSKAFAFKSKEEFIEFLRQQAPNGFSFTTYERDEFDEVKSEENTGHEIGSDWWNKWVKPGSDLFDQGADIVAEVWTNEVSQEYLADPHPDEEFSRLFRSVDDFNTHYYLGHDEAIRILKIGSSALNHTHQQYESLQAMEKAADTLAWWHNSH